MNKLSMFFKRHPLLALFLTSVVTICLINMAITFQAKRFGSAEEKEADAWNFGETGFSQPESLPSPETSEGALPEVKTADLKKPARDDSFELTGDEIETAEDDGFVFESAGNETSGLPAAAEISDSAVSAGTDSLAFDESETDVDTGLLPSESVMSLTDEVSAESGPLDFSAGSVAGAVEDSAETAAGLSLDEQGEAGPADAEESYASMLGLPAEDAAAEPEHVEFFADAAVDAAAEPGAESDPIPAENISIETESQTAENAGPAGDAAESVQAGSPAEIVDFFDNIAVADPDGFASDLNWKQTDLQSDAEPPASLPVADAGDLGWELIDESAEANAGAKVYEPHEPDERVAERFDAEQEKEIASPAGDLAAAAETGTSAPQTASAEPAETAAEPEQASAEPAVSTESGPAAEPEQASAEPAVSTESGPAAEPEQASAEPAVSTESGPAAEPERASAEPAVSTESGPAAESAPQTASAEPAETAAEPEQASAEPAVSTEADTSAASGQSPCVRRPVCGCSGTPDSSGSVGAESASVARAAAEPAAADQTAEKASAIRGTEVWAVSTENLSGYTTPANQLLCWRAEGGRFIASSVDEYKETLSADIPTVILIHGNMTDWNGALRHAQTLKHRIDQMRARQQIQTPYRLVIWKWPSERQDQRIRSDSQVKAYLADLNGFYLASFLSAINGSGNDVTMLGFSFGARTIGCALELMAGGTLYGRTLPDDQRYVAGDRYHAIFLAGACNYGDFSARGQYAHGGQLLSSVINVFNPSDNALHFYPLLYGAAGPQAIGVAPIDPNTASPSYKNRLWSINSSGYGPQHSFDNLLYSICDPLLGNMIYAGKIWSAADAIPSVSDGVVVPAVKQKSDSEAAQQEEAKIVAENE